MLSQKKAPKKLCTNQTAINFGETVEIILTRKEWTISIVHSFLLPICVLRLRKECQRARRSAGGNFKSKRANNWHKTQAKTLYINEFYN